MIHKHFKDSLNKTRNLFLDFFKMSNSSSKFNYELKKEENVIVDLRIKNKLSLHRHREAMNES